MLDSLCGFHLQVTAEPPSRTLALLSTSSFCRLSAFFSCHCHIRAAFQVDAHPLFTKLPPPPPPRTSFVNALLNLVCILYLMVSYLCIFLYKVWQRGFWSFESVFSDAFFCFLLIFGMLLRCSVPRWSRCRQCDRLFACMNTGRWSPHLWGGWSWRRLQGAMRLDWSGVVEDRDSVARLLLLVFSSHLERRRTIALRFTVLIFEYCVGFCSWRL